MRCIPTVAAACVVFGCAAGAWAQPAGGAAGTLTPIAPATGFQACVSGAVDAGTDGDVAGRLGFDDRPNDLLRDVWDCAADFAENRLVNIALAILGGLVVIMTIWTGVGFMLSGELDFGRLLGHLFLAGLGFMILDNYVRGSWILGNVGVVQLFANEAVELSERVIGRTDQMFATAYTQARQRTEEDLLSARALAEAGKYTELAERTDQPFGREHSLLELFDIERRMRIFVMARVRSVCLGLVACRLDRVRAVCVGFLHPDGPDVAGSALRAVDDGSAAGLSLLGLDQGVPARCVLHDRRCGGVRHDGSVAGRSLAAVCERDRSPCRSRFGSGPSRSRLELGGRMDSSRNSRLAGVAPGGGRFVRHHRDRFDAVGGPGVHPWQGPGGHRHRCGSWRTCRGWCRRQACG